MTRYVHELWWKRIIPGWWEARHRTHPNYKAVIKCDDERGRVEICVEEVVPGVHHIWKTIAIHKDSGTLWLHQLQELAVEMMQQEIIMREY